MSCARCTQLEAEVRVLERMLENLRNKTQADADSRRRREELQSCRTCKSGAWCTAHESFDI